MVMAIVTAWPASSPGAAETLDLPAPTGAGDYLVQNWQTDDGLPRNTVSSIVQDRHGYLWMGTPYGLVRYDGVRFVELEANGLPVFAPQSGRKLFCDRDGEIWFAPGRSGPYRLREGIAEPVLAAGEWGDVAIDSVLQDQQGVVWMVDANGRLGYVLGNRFTVTANLSDIVSGPMLFTLIADISGQPWFCKQDVYGQIINGQPTNYTRVANAVMGMAPSRDGGMWLSTGRNLLRIPGGNAVATSNVCSLPFGQYGVVAMKEDRNGALWLGTMRDGVYRLEGRHLKAVPGTHHQVSDLLEDAEGSIWAATDGAGVFKIRPRVFQIRGGGEGLTRVTVSSVSGDWVAPLGGGLGQIQPSGQVYMLPEHSIHSVASVIEDGAGGAWLGTAARRLIHRMPDGRIAPALSLEPAGTQLRVLHLDRQGNLWIGGFPFGLYMLPAGKSSGVLNLNTKVPARAAITAIAEDAAGGIWIGTGIGGLFQFKEGKFTSQGSNGAITSFPIGALLADKAGNLWVGTLGGGLGRFRDGELEFLSKRSGLRDNVISQLIEDDLGLLWVGTSRGIERVRLAELIALADGRTDAVSASHYGQSDGLANVQCTVGSQPSVWKTRAGTILFATSHGVVSFDPARLPINLRPPPLILESVLVDGRPVTSQDAVQLRHDLKKLEFRYNATSFVAPEKMMFKRRLLGFDEDWIIEGDNNRRTASYPRLPPGSYAFQFNACNNDGIWRDEVFTLRLEVIPAFWQTAWFRAALAFIFAGTVGGAVLVLTRMRMRRKLARLEQANALERERTRISRDLHDDLGARLTQMALLTDLAAEDPAAAPDLREQIKEVSGQARHAVQSLDETVWMINPQKDTLVHVIGYVARYAEQFFQATPITCLQDICRQPPGCMMPGKLRRDILMLVKEALNNVLKHSQASEVRLRISVLGGVMQIAMRDNGRGFAAGVPAAQRHGMDSMLRRAENAGIRVTVRSQPGRGTLVALRVRLPLANKLPRRAKD
jgi:signal transduction histidine kinase/ligand-binding sensor domain-containing protein